MIRIKKEYSIIQNILYVLHGVWQYDKLTLGLIAVNTLVLAVSPFIGIVFPRLLISELLNAKQMEVILLLLVSFFILASLAGYIGNYLRGAFMPRPEKVAAPYAALLYKKCLESDFQCTEDPSFLNEMQTAACCFGGSYAGMKGILHKLFTLPGFLIALAAYISIVSRLNVLILFCLVLNILLNYGIAFAQKKYENSKKHELSQNERRSEYLYNIMYDFKYGKEIRLYGIGDWLAELFALFRGKSSAIKARIQNYNLLTGCLSIVLSILREGLVYTYLINMVVNKGMSIADFTMYATTIASFTGAFNLVVSNFADIGGLSMQITDYRRFISQANPMTQAEYTEPLPAPPYGFVFQNVSFKYPRSQNYIFENLNLTIAAGQKLAVVGNNGSGKSTFIKLLLRLYDVNDGAIFCNGVNIKLFDRDEYYRLFSAVFQEVLPLAFSLADNIGVSNYNSIDLQRVNQCIEQSGLADKVNSLKYGVNTCVQKFIDGEGIEFSGGEAQKLLIARALYKNAEVMVLDEPTAALDALAERQIYESFNKITQNKTTVYISHRLASTRFCDAITLFEYGKIIEYGTHEELLSLNGNYANMFNKQAEYYADKGGASF